MATEITTAVDMSQPIVRRKQVSAGNRDRREGASIGELARSHEVHRRTVRQAIAELTRFHLHLDDDQVKGFVDDLLGLIDEYIASEPTRHDAPGYGGIIVVHRMAAAE